MNSFNLIISIILVIIIIGSIIITISQWKILTKAGKPGWISLIPYYNQYVFFEIVGMEGWYVFLSFIPIVGAIILSVLIIISYINLAKCFGKSESFAVGLILLPIIFFPLLAYSNSTYDASAVNKKNRNNNQTL